VDLVWKVYIGVEVPSRPWSINITSICLYLVKSTMAEHTINLSHSILLNDTSILAKKCTHRLIIREAIEFKLLIHTKKRRQRLPDIIKEQFFKIPAYCSY
jgi:hypothetical protein